MINNYFKLAIKVLGRNKFFTFISLFGISFTLMILMLVTSFMDTVLGNHAPLTHKDKMVFMQQAGTFKQYYDTLTTIDTTFLDSGIAQYDTTYQYNEDGKSMSRSSIGYAYIDKYLKKISSAKKMTFYTSGHSFDMFLNSNKLTFDASYTDANFWDIHEFNFLAGVPYQETQVENQEPVAVLSQKAAKQYFGDYKNIIGKEIEMEKKHYKVIGVIDEVPSSIPTFNKEVYIPYTHVKPKRLASPDLLGRFNVTMLADSEAGVNKIKEEILHQVKSIEIPPPNDYDHNQVEITPMTYNEAYARGLVYYEDPQKSLKYVVGFVSFLLMLFFLLPTLNLINLNISRIMERSSEIGVRKAFGASSSNILFQFVFENIILTFIGGAIGFVLALILINIINSSQWLEDTTLSFNYRVFFYSLLICLFFGILSGLIPAYRMSKVHIVNALKQNLK